MMDDPSKKSDRRATGATEPETDGRNPDGSRRSVGKTRLASDKPFTIGRQGFAKISAVEGLRLSDEMKRDLRDLDRRGLSGDERRRVIISKYGRKLG